jgi:FecR protein
VITMSDNRNDLHPVADRPNPDDEAVIRLLQLAGHRPEIPAADTAIVKAAARAEWQRAVWAARRRTYWYHSVGGLLAAAAVVLVAFNAKLFQRADPPQGEPVATLELVAGQVMATVAGRELADLSPGQTLLAGSIVETGLPGSAQGEQPRAALRLASGGSLRLDTGTRLQLLSRTTLALERGAVYVDSGATPLSTSLAISTPLGVARDIGTQFEVRLGAAAGPLEVRVREGRVLLSHHNTAREVEAGRALTVITDGQWVEREVSLHGPDWEWGIYRASHVHG